MSDMTMGRMVRSSMIVNLERARRRCPQGQSWSLGQWWWCCAVRIMDSFGSGCFHHHATLCYHACSQPKYSTLSTLQSMYQVRFPSVLCCCKSWEGGGGKVFTLHVHEHIVHLFWGVSYRRARAWPVQQCDCSLRR